MSMIRISKVSMVAVVSMMTVSPGRALGDGPAESRLKATVVLEAGPSYVLQNEGEYGTEGTRFAAKDVGQQENLVKTWRNSLELGLGRRHTIILLYAPFELRTHVELQHNLVFRDSLFAAGTVINHRYMFDAYRGSYLYRALSSNRLSLELGASLQVRNAKVAFSEADGFMAADESDIGLVFAPKARLTWCPSARAPWAALEADGFSTFGLGSKTNGSLYDVQLTMGHQVARGVNLFAGARLYGGGAKVEAEQMYNWANFLTFTVGARFGIGDLLGGGAAQ